jgi:3-methyladenine DNA glycosylase AlkC
MEPFKLLINENVVHAIGGGMARAWPGFPRQRFERAALAGLDALELKARAMHVADALEATLPPDFLASAAVLEAAMQGADGLSGWALWPVGEFIARRGLAQPERALDLLRMLTPRFTAEYAIRPFIVAHAALAFATLQRWTQDPDEHVRRLASEGSRPRLPWGLQLKSLIADPSPTLPIIEALLDDPSEYVRRSVANHLNDIAKDHPALVADWLDRHLPDASAQRRALLRHASRTLIKRGDARVLHAWGVGKPLRGTALLTVAPARLALGGSLVLDVALQAAGRGRQLLAIDYAVHHVKANGATSPKVFKGWQLELAPGEARVLRKTHAVRAITTRRYFAGLHRIELLVNGRPVAEATFELST